jgi:hypothetical protein
LLDITKYGTNIKRLTLLSSENSELDVLILSQRDMKAIASLQHLELLDLGGNYVFDEACEALIKCSKLKYLCSTQSLDLGSVLPVIGRNLKGLQLGMPMAGTVADILKYCPGIEYVEFDQPNEDTGVERLIEEALKKGLKRLASLKVGRKSIRLGTD